MKALGFLLLVAACLNAAKLPTAQLLEMAGRNPAPVDLPGAIIDTLGQADLRKGTAVVGEGPDFLWAVETKSTPSLVIDEGKRLTMQRFVGSDLWFTVRQLELGTSHMFHYVVDGADFGGKNDVPAYLPQSYSISGVPQGKLSEKLVHQSKIYPGMQSNYWIYVPAQYDPKTPAALMVWQDGEGHINREGGARTLNVIDNLIAQKRIPVMIQVFISPGLVGDKRMRSIEYDTVDDTYARFLRDEILAEAAQHYNLRQDSYSRAIAGNSSGGICSFNAAWFPSGTVRPRTFANR